MKQLLLFTLVATFGITVLLSAPPYDPAIYPGSKFTGFGASGAGRIAVELSGDVEKPGRYFFPKNASLLDLMLRIGTPSFSGYEGPPTDIRLTRAGAESKDYIRVRFTQKKPEELARIPIEDGMRAHVVGRVL